MTYLLDRHTSIMYSNSQVFYIKLILAGMKPNIFYYLSSFFFGWFDEDYEAQYLEYKRNLLINN